jgi:hypothetical protein
MFPFLKAYIIYQMKIIFLDIDGVLNSETYYRTVERRVKNWTRFDPKVVDFIIKLIEEFTLKIVISSTWRFGAIKQLNNELKKSGLIKFLHKDWNTPQTYPPHKGKEIQIWLQKHPDIHEYLILDDDESILNEQKPRFVKTNLTNGMQEEHYNRAREILLGQKSN